MSLDFTKLKIIMMVGLDQTCHKNMRFHQFRFDYSGQSAIEFKGHSRVEATAEADGPVDAVFMWWDLQMDVPGDVILSCAPKWAHPTPEDMQVRSALCFIAQLGKGTLCLCFVVGLTMDLLGRCETPLCTKIGSSYAR